MKKLITAMAMASCILFSTSLEVYAQEDEPLIITFTTVHWNMDMKDFSMDEWKKVESEYHEKVVMKNDFILGSGVLMHYYSPDNSELIFVQVFKNWADLENARKRTTELSKEAWPDDDKRGAFFDKQSAYYSDEHSDEIYSGLPMTKTSSEKSTEPTIFYIRKTHFAYPKDAKAGEIKSLREEFVNNVIHKNDDILAYYPMRHLYGADSREFVEVFVTKSLADLENTNKNKRGELIEAHWPDEEKRKEFFTAYNKYFEPWHGDWIYTNVPELSK